MKNIFKSSILSVVSLALLGLVSMSYAEDIDIIDAEKNTVPPNILFVLDGSGSMGEMVGSSGLNRMDTVKNALKTLISAPETVDMNIGVMSFSNAITDGSVVTPYDSNHYVHGPAYPVSQIDGDTDGDGTPDQSADDVLRLNNNFTSLGGSYVPAVSLTDDTRAYTKKIIDQWSIGGGTPIVGALFEAAKYMRGENIHWGNLDPSRIESAHPSTYTGGFVADGSITSVETCSASYGKEYCDKSTSCTIARDFSCTTVKGALYLSDTDVLGHSCNTNDPSPLEYCSKGQTFCGIGTAATCSLNSKIPEKIIPSSSCTSIGATVAICNALPQYSNCQSHTVEGSSVATIRCDLTIEEWDQYVCPATPATKAFTCFTPIEVCTQNRCRTSGQSALTYNSPINTECQNNAIILLSDGAPTVNNSASLVTDMIDSTNALNCKNTAVPADIYDYSSKESIDYYGRCGVELARFLANADNSSGSVGHNIAGDQPINLYTIGFALSAEPDAEQYLSDLATAGGGASYTAGDEAKLIAAFKDAISGANKKPRVFSSPTYQASATQSLLHGASVYLPIFNSQSGPRWSGNLKKFTQVDGVLKDKDGKDIYDKNGLILGSAKGEWSATTGSHSHAVTDGGAANKLDPAARKVLTDDGKDIVPLTSAHVSAAQLGASSAEVTQLISYATGYDSDGTTPRHSMGDIIHSKPIYFAYKGLSRAKGGLIFVGTNEGYLHAINDSDGTEAFAYMPQELLKNIKTLSDNDSDVDHKYGVDGPISLRFKDVNKNGVVDTGGAVAADNDQVILYFGLRRGGKAYYALDVTNPNSPKLLWKIDNTKTGFDQLGFTWSKPKIAEMLVGTIKKTVLIFGGGYVDDNGGEADNAGPGSNIYIVNADNGALIYKPADSAISYAVAGNVREVDVNRDGLVDRLYFGDTGGTIWRLDLNVKAASANATSGSVKARLESFAELGSVASPATTRRKFFNEPDVAIFRRNGQLSLTVAIGSGDRANPLDPNGDDRFFVMFDKNVNTIPSKKTTALDINALGTPGSPKASGWQLDLTLIAGEKVLSTALTFQNNIIFTSFGKGSTTSVPTAANGCSAASSNQSRVYVMDLLKGDAAFDLDLGNPSKEISKIIKGPSFETPPVIFPGMYKLDSPTGKYVKGCEKGNCIRGFTIPGVATNSTPGANDGLRNSLPRVYWIDKD